MTTGNNVLTALEMLLCAVIACFYLLRIISHRRWLSQFDVENEVGHGIMAVGMIYMLMPVSMFSPDFLGWNMIIFALAALWWTLRLCVHKPLLVFVLGESAEYSPISSDAIHVVMYLGMSFMFALMLSMAFSMTPFAILFIRVFFFFFAFLTFFYGQEILQVLRVTKVDWLTLSANIAHILMSGMMCWMFFGMLSMSLTMNIH